MYPWMAAYEIEDDRGTPIRRGVVAARLDDHAKQSTAIHGAEVDHDIVPILPNRMSTR